ncbi:MUC16 protein, partial [Podargus strigoides]|nr:MUC16 protein [Podargus strigoides]
TTAAALKRFTVNFTITNLPYNSDLETPKSAKFNTECRACFPVHGWLQKPQGLALQQEGAQEDAQAWQCLFCRPGRAWDDTGVDAICTTRKEPSSLPLDRVGLYHEVSNKTRGITQLGPYSLDKDSLYVNG